MDIGTKSGPAAAARRVATNRLQLSTFSPSQLNVTEDEFNDANANFAYLKLKFV
jgi:hypothetical protein